MANEMLSGSSGISGPPNDSKAESDGKKPENGTENNVLKDIDVNLNDLKVLEDEFKRARHEYKAYNYNEALHIFRRVLDESIRLEQTETETKALKYLSKLSLYKGDCESCLFYLTKLDINAKHLSLLARCLFLQHQTTRLTDKLYIAKHVLHLLLCHPVGQEARLDSIAASSRQDLNFWFKNNLLLLEVLWRLKEYPAFYSLLDKLRSFLKKSAKRIKGLYLIRFNGISHSTRTLLCSSSDSNTTASPVAKSLERGRYEGALEHEVELVDGICNNIAEDTVELRVGGEPANDTMAKLTAFYADLEKARKDPYKKNLVVKLETAAKERFEPPEEQMTTTPRRTQQTRLGQRDVKRRIIALEGASTKSVYLKNYWTALCNFFYLKNFDNAVNLDPASRREGEDEEALDSIYPSDIARYLKYSESFYSLKLMTRLRTGGTRRISEATRRGVLERFFGKLEGQALAPIDFSLTLLEFLLSRYQLGNNHKSFQVLLAHVYNYATAALMARTDPGPQGNFRDLATSRLYKFNSLLAGRGPHVAKFKELNRRYGARMLFVLYRGMHEAVRANRAQTGGDDANEVVNRAYCMGLFSLYKLCRNDHLAKIHVLYFQTKRHQSSRLEVSKHVYQLMQQYKHIARYAKRLDGRTANTDLERANARKRAERLDAYTKKLLHNIGDAEVNADNVETQLNRFVRRFFGVVASYMDEAAVKCVYHALGGEGEGEWHEVAATYAKHAARKAGGMLHRDIEAFLVDAAAFVSDCQEPPEWTDQLLLFFGDLLSVVSFNLHKNSQTNDSTNFVGIVGFDAQFLLTLSSTLLVVLNALYHATHRSTLARNGHAGGWEPAGAERDLTNCLKEIELVNGYNLILKSTVSRIYTNAAFTLYYLVSYLIPDYAQQDAQAMYFLYVTLSQALVTMLSAFFVTRVTAQGPGQGDVELELCHLACVFREGGDAGAGEDPADVVNSNVGEYYYTFNNIVETLLQLDLVFRENGLSVDARLVPTKLRERLYARADGLEFADSARGTNLSVATAIFNKLMGLFNPSFAAGMRRDLEVVERPNHLLNEEYLETLHALHAHFRRQAEELNERKRDWSAIAGPVYDLSNKCVSSLATRGPGAPVVALVHAHFKKHDYIDTYLYTLKAMLDQMAVPTANGLPYFKANPNPLILDRDAAADTACPKLEEYAAHLSRLREAVALGDQFAYGEVARLFNSAPRFDFMESHKMIYQRILRSMSTVDTISNFDIESFSTEVLTSQLEEISLARALMPDSLDVPFVAAVKNFELFLSILDAPRFHHSRAFTDAGGAGTERLVRRLMHLLHVTIDRYSQLVTGRAQLGPADLGRLLFFGDHESPAFDWAEVGTPGTFSSKLDYRLRLLHFMRVILLVNSLRRGELIPSGMLFNDYHALIRGLSGAAPERPAVASRGNPLDDFVLSLPPNHRAFGNPRNLYLLYLQTKLLERITKNVPLDNVTATLFYAKIMVNFKQYIEILIGKKLAKRRKAEGEEEEPQPEPAVERDMGRLNEAFEAMYDGREADDELMIVFYKMHVARLRLCYLRPALSHLAAPFAFSRELNRRFNWDSYHALLDANNLQDWALLVAYHASAGGVTRADVLADVMAFLHRVKNR